MPYLDPAPMPIEGWGRWGKNENDFENGTVQYEVGDTHESADDTITDILYHRDYEVIILKFEGEGDIWIPDHRLVKFTDQLD